MRVVRRTHRGDRVGGLKRWAGVGLVRPVDEVGPVRPVDERSVGH